MKKSEAALVTINKAMTIDPKNPLCKFHRASILFSMDKHQVWTGHLMFLSEFTVWTLLQFEKSPEQRANVRNVSVSKFATVVCLPFWTFSWYESTNSLAYLRLFVFVQQEALEELEELKKIVPREALVYFLISKVSYPNT